MSDAGMSADAWAAAARAEARGGLLRGLLRLLGLDRRGARAEIVARRREAGAVGERMTAELLAPLLHGEGWHGLYDRALPGGGRANADHVLVPPCGGLVVNVDSKLWSARYRVSPGAGGAGLWHGANADRSRCLSSIQHETRCITAALGVPVVSVIAVHNAPVTGGGFMVDGIRVVPADRLLPALRSLTGRPNPSRARALAQRAAVVLPRYGQGATQAG